jgi:hypothetical protein
MPKDISLNFRDERKFLATERVNLTMMHPLIASSCMLFFFTLVSIAGAAEVKEIATPEEFRQAITQLRPGMTLKLRPGDYGAGYHLKGVQGTAEQPVIIKAAMPDDPPRFGGGNVGLQLQGCSHVILRDLRIEGQKGNGLNIDDMAGPAHHITLENLAVADIGPKGNTDGIKLSGLTDFVVRKCRVSGWGGQAVDMVGCHRGVVENCRFEGKPGFTQGAGPQTKGGSEDIVIRSCTFLNPGERPVNIGGSTGRAHFRPLDAKYEARRITVEGCLFISGMAGVAFVGVDTGVVRFNTFVNPEMWAVRILQENREPGMVACGNSRFENNLIVITTGTLRTWLNISPGTRPETFTFANNWWFHHGNGQSAKPQLPSAESNGTYGIDPQLDSAADYKPRLPEAQKVGHTAFKRS